MDSFEGRIRSQFVDQIQMCGSWDQLHLFFNKFRNQLGVRLDQSRINNRILAQKLLEELLQEILDIVANVDSRG